MEAITPAPMTPARRPGSPYACRRIPAQKKPTAARSIRPTTKRCDRPLASDKLADHYHGDGAAQIGYRREQADGGGIRDSRGANQVRRPEVKAVGTDLDQEVDQPQLQEPGRLQGAQQRVAADVLVLVGDAIGKQRLLIRCQPSGVLNAVLQHLENEATEPDARQTTNQEQPVPAPHPEDAVQV